MASFFARKNTQGNAYGLDGTDGSSPKRHAPVPELFWPAAMLFVAGAICLVCWGIYSLLPQTAAGSEKYLRRALLTPTFNPNGAAVPMMPEVWPQPQRAEPTPAPITE